MKATVLVQIYEAVLKKALFIFLPVFVILSDFENLHANYVDGHSTKGSFCPTKDTTAVAKRNQHGERPYSG